MQMKTHTEITTEFSKTDVENIIKNYVESQGYEVIKIETKTETKHRNVTLQESMYGATSIPTIEFAGFKIFLKTKDR